MSSSQHLADRNIALDLVRITEAAALVSARYVGRGDPDDMSEAASDALRIAFQSLHIKGTVVTSKNPKNPTPMLNDGEQVGFGDGLEVDVAFDPVDGIQSASRGHHNAMSVVAMATRGAMFSPLHSRYAFKMAVCAEAAAVVDLNAPVKDNLQAMAKAMGKDVRDLKIFVLDRPRHEALINEIRAVGAQISLHRDGDIVGALLAFNPHADMDMMIGAGGTSEAVVTACAAKGSGGQFLIRLDPQTDDERRLVEADGFDLSRVYGIDDLVKGECFFAGTGITDGELVDGVHYKGDYAVTHSLITRGRTGTWRQIEAWHNLKKLSKMSSIRY
ncbi:MAG: class II fructose-bisphosphatase [Succinivibrionaceae bacterium]|nr:class II fructose-bisphosphatase [Succinivibrionaceae bacterium]